MKLEPFNHATKQWDRFKEFYTEVLVNHRHYYQSPFIHLETGEFIVTQGYFKPLYRRHYEKQNIAIVQSDDYRWSRVLNDYKLTTPDGDLIKQSWLCYRGSQSLWIDHDSGHVVRMLQGVEREANKRIPKRLRGKCGVYYAAPDEAPIGAMPISVTEVDKLKPDEKEHINTIRAACKAWNELSEEAKVKVPSTLHMSNVYNPATRCYESNSQYVSRHPMHVTDLLRTTFNDMDWQARKRVALRGVISRKKTTEFTHLLLTK